MTFAIAMTFAISIKLVIGTARVIWPAPEKTAPACCGAYMPFHAGAVIKSTAVKTWGE